MMSRLSFESFSRLMEGRGLDRIPHEAPLFHDLGGSRGISEAGGLLEALPRWGFELI